MTMRVHDVGALDDLGALVRAGTLDPRELVEVLLARIAAVDGEIQAWCGIDREGALRQADERAREIREGRPRGPLHGIPFAVKDVIDVAGWPTRAGSKLRQAVAPASLDAEIVAAAKAAGAILLGKVHTTEFAYFDGPPPTRNPWNTAHTPGGSSSGPAAAVAGGMAAFSLGTQTAGSVVRPAAYCGVAAFKPTTLGVSSFGILPFAPSFDTPGYFAYRAQDAAAVARAVQPPVFAAVTEAAGHTKPESSLRVGIVSDALLADASADVIASLDRAERSLSAAGLGVERITTPQPLQGAIALHTTITEYELARAHGSLLAAREGDVSDSLRRAVQRGIAIADGEYQQARAALAAARRRFWSHYAPWDVLVFPAAPGEAPAGTKTGDPRFIIPFTALAGPIMTVPVGVSANGLPLGLMVIGRPGSDGALIDASLAVAREIEMPREQLPATGS
jgi:aspartyl-tRNA(Asn)/glutamyl-tRNA(Gln) amidotransferase subunit A